MRTSIANIVVATLLAGGSAAAWPILNPVNGH